MKARIQADSGDTGDTRDSESVETLKRWILATFSGVYNTHSVLA